MEVFDFAGHKKLPCGLHTARRSRVGKPWQWLVKFINCILVIAYFQILYTVYGWLAAILFTMVSILVLRCVLVEILTTFHKFSERIKLGFFALISVNTLYHAQLWQINYNKSFELRAPFRILWHCSIHWLALFTAYGG